MKFIHITDTHLLNRADESFYGLNTRDSFEKAIATSLSSFPQAEFILLTGDVSQTGEDASYQQLKTVIEKFDKPVYCVPGNHDKPHLLQRVLSLCPKDEINIVDAYSYPLILINSCKEGTHQGEVSQQSLTELECYLAHSQANFLIFAIHHPPALTGSAWLDKLGLQNKQELLNVIGNYSNKSIMLCGHIHQELEVQYKNLRIIATPSTCYQFTPKSAQILINQAQRPAYRLVSIANAKNFDTTVHFVD